MDQSQQSSPQNSTSTQSQGAGQLLDQAKQLLNKGNVSDLLGQLPNSVKDLGTKATTGYNKLSTTQKVVGGAAIALGVGLLLTNRKKGTGDKKADTLHELLLFVNDRIEGYKKAADESQDPELQGYYKQLVSQSQRFASELNNHLRLQGGEREDGTTVKGKIYRRFMEATSAVTGHSEKTILATNIHGEMWALKAYKEALSDKSLTGALRQEVERQHTQSQQTYDKLKRLAEKQS
ncbi:hypothetical protein GCM10011375_35610 [Hymenobacter qilianensis]|uniref:Uncharacterized protein n=2 Tax=Hymenobacter qilianensis TaxID=1385715 RepID=A0ACB5PVW7_9BACT|nr:PA2169 family four-helix-bundle protein [Hymenobacter qilianensis]QNP51209.1 PA2169 family four-helix-bundle protein [Hymenobacter qilianensis]GGF77415.1 hypothetical protein GCM10011375_35610 [Hymenobacter qilianensis]